MDTQPLFDALVAYIDAAIEAKIDRGESADGGLVSSIHKHRMADDLRLQLDATIETLTQKEP